MRELSLPASHTCVGLKYFNETKIKFEFQGGGRRKRPGNLASVSWCWWVGTVNVVISPIKRLIVSLCPLPHLHTDCYLPLFSLLSQIGSDQLC